MKYTTPEIEIVRFEAMEVLAASGDGDNDDPGSGTEEW